MKITTRVIQCPKSKSGDTLNGEFSTKSAHSTSHCSGKWVDMPGMIPGCRMLVSFSSIMHEKLDRKESSSIK